MMCAATSDHSALLVCHLWEPDAGQISGVAMDLVPACIAMKIKDGAATQTSGKSDKTATSMISCPSRVMCSHVDNRFAMLSYTNMEVLRDGQ
jgi:hypothetical protein